MVDSKRQIILHAETHGGNNESQYTREFLSNSTAALLEGGIPDTILKDATLIADTGFFSEDNLKFLDDENHQAIIPDNNFRKRDPRFQTMERHRTLYVAIPKYGRNYSKEMMARVDTAVEEFYYSLVRCCADLVYTNLCFLQ
jgi:hypothetical protein